MEKSKKQRAKKHASPGQPRSIVSGPVMVHLRSTAEDRARWEREAKLAGDMKLGTFIKAAVESYIQAQKMARAAMGAKAS